MKGAVIGAPIGHSLSPRIFSFLSQSLKEKKFTYEALEVKPQELSHFISKAKSKYVGLNVTLPHKEEVIKVLDVLSPEAKVLGAVNCILFKMAKAGQIQSVGYNTDVMGFSQSLIENKVNFVNQVALILGAGGAARAVAYSLATLGCSEILIFNKTLTRSEGLALEFSRQFTTTRFIPLKEISLIKNISLIVNATPLGMDGFSGDERKFFDDLFKNSFKDTVAFDLIYRPEITYFLKTAIRHGFSHTISGLDMLIYQALATWEIWFGIQLEKKTLKEALTVELRKFLKPHSVERPKRIYITGFMGVGKTTVAKIVAQKLGWTFIDIDHVIEEKMGKTIGEIFKKEGESFFRNLESEIIREYSAKDNVVVALGGGALNREANLSLIKTSGTLIYLSASVEKLAQRLKNSWASRPLLRHDKEMTLANHIEDLLKKRMVQYKQAKFEVNTDQGNDMDVAIKIMDLFKVEL